ncbi:unnamed protein product [Diatraea saccharalis]|uniref:Uncharacterized protein n=1 Tax=Diatraea saccharalis TaxID=40085 RepID=A0A9N9QY83_9NEOP|nr:unnamed protein product [Diatraea saccharalis]
MGSSEGGRKTLAKLNFQLLLKALQNTAEESLATLDTKAVTIFVFSDERSVVTSLYIYTGTPPHGYGSQAPKVAETILRSIEYNRKPDPKNRKIKVGNIEIERFQWEKGDGKFPHDKIHGNYITSVFKEMTINFAVLYSQQIKTVVERVMDQIMSQISDILTQGRQTFCPLREQSVTAAQAYEAAFDFLNTNTGRDCFSLLDWIQVTVECFEKEEITVKRMKKVTSESEEVDPLTT